ncbi:hypothetical protein CR513_21224, partial [Mucuna pruriens]
MAYDQAGKERKLQLQELEELRLEAYENSQIYKQKIMQFHDRQILRKEFRVSQKVLLFNSRLKLIACKLHSRWNEPFVITNVFPHGVVELIDEATNNTFLVNKHQLKIFHEKPTLIVGKIFVLVCFTSDISTESRPTLDPLLLERDRFRFDFISSLQAQKLENHVQPQP